ncbi:energy transducer TonB [Stenotrophomonas sp. C3(2023)]|uniref:energy transducer TonB n=1 Tax=Stenotrophomonas sp. C3(2023) TaxID=3080277 RepID=UPI00293C5689|nr:energy transducer TonB [Stenotrophomonas sp. C3(2023)]MDV3468824.1 energy transducer TonB [Stenotrophomonas sp. C3(2023)]
MSQRQHTAVGSRTRHGLGVAVMLVLAVAGGNATAKAAASADAPATSAAQAGDVHASVRIASKNANPPRYPPAAFRENREGDAIVLIKVDAKGQWTDASVLQSTGWPDLDQAAMEATRRWQYTAASQDGVAVPGEVQVPMSFRLN